MEQEIIRLDGVSKIFYSENGHEVLAVDKVDLSIQESEFVCLLGPSGSGKSTVLRMLAGLTPASSGKVSVLGEEVVGPRPEASMVLQDYSLLPWRSVLENVAFGLELRRVPKEERIRIATEMVEKVGLGDFLHAAPYELSGGMQQRAAIARALATDPRILYMDEPFGALDAFTRRQMQQELLSLWLKDKKTVLFVTHSVEEAVYLATRIVVMSARPGRIIADFPVDIPYPRRSSDSEFGRLVDELMHLLMELAYER
ncbi:MAG: ABC transporter ATP-binding protein [Firmicutes bacterium]|nr:ABC transporter ATP-binding protein [Bacillota bacterium]